MTWKCLLGVSIRGKTTTRTDVEWLAHLHQTPTINNVYPPSVLAHLPILNIIIWFWFRLMMGEKRSATVFNRNFRTTLHLGLDSFVFQGGLRNPLCLRNRLFNFFMPFDVKLISFNISVWRTLCRIFEDVIFLENALLNLTTDNMIDGLFCIIVWPADARVTYRI